MKYSNQNPPLTDYDPCAARYACDLAADAYNPPGLKDWQYPAFLQVRRPGAIIVPGQDGDRCFIWRPPSGERWKIYVVFTGTRDLEGLLSDFDAVRVPFVSEMRDLALQRGLLSDFDAVRIPFERDGGVAAVHAGFDRGLDVFWPLILATIQHVSSTGPAGARPAITFVGHSRGASQAILAAMKYWLREELPVDFVHAFAPARPGNAAFRNCYNRILGRRTNCYQHSADIVPWEPPWIWGSRAVGRRIWFSPFLQSPVVNPRLPLLAASCALLTLRGWVKHPPQIVQLADHHIAAYRALLA